ncbi:RraA family protein [Roseicitreum antarcticum]|uniref:Putative 4-hydroxy-4-methyl-2-oxoglutarate aldolase n=1 Tax=Roseicitreum antarcticum TaxID=564137 RepID=A0A1H2TPG9_9RHOB|nr:4-hydroxy-4-methyl-2-oxoglutarate aldolase [Roseicitreum antarcticum]SDW45194.1 Regulator of RNase E activity RraA [Roseicitreum antarcticum]
MYTAYDMPERLPQADLDLLAQAETATIGHFRNIGFMDIALSPLRPGQKLCGTAVTIALPSLDSSMLHYALSDVRPGDVLVIDRLQDRRFACIGGGVALAAVAAGVAGVIVDGPCTDPSEIVEAGLPLWSRGVSPITTRMASIGGALNIPVSCGGAVVMPGDAILADESGIVVLRPHEVADTAREAIRRQERGASRQDMLRRGETRIGDLSGARDRVAKALSGPS